MFSSKFVVKCVQKSKNYICKNNFNMDLSVVKKHGREVTILSKKLEIISKCHERLT